RDTVSIETRSAFSRSPKLFSGVNSARVLMALAFSLSISYSWAADLIGTVRKGSSPVPSATVTLTPARPPAAGPKRTATTDSKGRYVFTGLVPGDYLLNCGATDVSVHVDYANNGADCVQ